MCSSIGRARKKQKTYLVIPAYNKVFIGRSHNNGSKKEYINVFEV